MKCDVCSKEFRRISWVGRPDSEYKRPVCSDCVVDMRQHLFVAGIDFVVHLVRENVYTIDIRGVVGKKSKCPLLETLCCQRDTRKEK